MKPLVIFDLDGTLSDARHRRHFLGEEPPDWTSFYESCGEDKPLWPTIRVAHALHTQGYELWLFSGRIDRVIERTKNWLAQHGMHNMFSWMQFRRDGDHTPDDVLKMQWYDNMLVVDRTRLLLTFDDRDRIVKAWRDRGVTCFQVAPGNF